ncbi:MAG: EAL domain-containing protein [Pseudomonadota bacterium]
MAAASNERVGRKRNAALKNLDLVYRAGTAGFARTLGLASPAGLAGKTDHDLLPAPVATVYQALEQQVLASGVPDVSTSRLAQGTEEQVVVRSPVIADDGSVTGLEINILDLNELATDYVALLGRDQDMKSLMSRSPFALMIRRDNDTVYQNRRWSQLTPDNVLQVEKWLLLEQAEGSSDDDRLYFRSCPVRWRGEVLQAVFCFPHKRSYHFVEKRTGARRGRTNDIPAVLSPPDVNEVEATLFKAIHSPVIVCDNTWQAVYTNQPASELLDADAHPPIAQWFNDREKVDIDLMLRQRDTIEPAPLYSVTLANRVYSVSVSPTSWLGRSALLLVLQHDPDLQQQLQGVQSELKKYKDYAAAGGDFQWEMDGEQKMSSLSVDMEPLLGVENSAVLGVPLSSVIERFVDAEDLSQWSVLSVDMRNRRTFRGKQLKWRHHTGEKRVVRLSGMPVFDSEEQFIGYRGIGSDVTEAFESASTMAFHASHDSLTGLVNRREFEQRCDNAIVSARDSRGSHALCFLDLDNFKIVNDTSGHLAGDELLRQLSSLFSSLVRKSDVLARLGGDEFAVLVYDVGVNEVMRLANQLRSEVESFQFLWEDNRFRVGVSIGVVIIDDRWEGRAALFRAADSACYEAKNLGRNRVAVYKDTAPVHDATIKAGSWVERINSAIDEKRVRLCMQKIQALDGYGDQPTRIELFMRIMEQSQPISPGVFMPAADRYGLTIKLDKAVIERAIDWLEGQPHVTDTMQLCAINLHSRSFADEEFTTFLIKALQQAKFDVSVLCFVLAETAVIANLSTATQFMTRVGETGCKFALDDFGSGLSSFTYLKNLPISYLKIDGKYIRNILQESVDYAMVKAINEIGQVLGKQTIAEFVESDEVLEKLREMGVDLAQGYQIGKPELIDY